MPQQLVFDYPILVPPSISSCMFAKFPAGTHERVAFVMSASRDRDGNPGARRAGLSVGKTPTGTSRSRRANLPAACGAGAIARLATSFSWFRPKPGSTCADAAAELGEVRQKTAEAPGNAVATER